MLEVNCCDKLVQNILVLRLSKTLYLKEGFFMFFRPRTRPKTFLQCFALEQRKSKAKHYRNAIGRKN